ncbi:hypothetical protein DH2020_031156 [Rehmannia glutinosa]|uniref:Uncharacterized protein n=1 Tax=Rehmannia glutinosa TaxID=99300 RepID=A0ABR0VKG0_REHGL
MSKILNRSEANYSEGFFQEESFEPFDFLAIGTFGVELLNTDPPTPTLTIPFEELTNQQTEITEKDLKLINYEHEKFIEAEENETASDTSGRSSQASIITLSNKPTEGADSEDHMYTVACPLQNYLFATSIELTETDKERNNTDHDDHIRKCEGAAQPRKRNVAHFMKKVVKKFHCSSSSSTASSKNDAAVSISIKKTFKALKMFHRKVHPEEITEKQFVKLKKGEKKGISHEDACQIGGDNEMVGQACSKKSEKNTRKVSPERGHWIKTDSDCKLNVKCTHQHQLKIT